MEAKQKKEELKVKANESLIKAINNLHRFELKEHFGSKCIRNTRRY